MVTSRFGNLWRWVVALPLLLGCLGAGAESSDATDGASRSPASPAPNEAAQLDVAQVDVTKLDVTVDVQGVTGELRANVMAFLSIERAAGGGADGVRDAAHVERLHERASEEIAQALQPFGYYSVLIDAQLESLATDQWQATYVIDPGVRTQLARPDIETRGAGSELPAYRSRLEQLALVLDAPLDHRVYETEKRALIAALYDAGYLDASFTQAELRIDPATARAAIRWRIDTGRRYYFGPLTIEQDALLPALVERYHAIKPGDVYSARRLIDLQLALNNSNYYSQVTLDVDHDAAVDGHIPVVVTATARKRRRYSSGLGFGTDTGPRVSAGIENRRVNRRGHRYRGSLRASAIEREFTFEYDVPIKNIARDRWRFYAQVEDADIGDADATQYSLGAAREDSWLGMRRRLFANVERSDFRFGEQPRRHATLVYPGAALSFDKLDNPQFVRRGYSVAASIHGGLDAVGSSTDFLAAQLSGRAIFPLGSRGRLLAAAAVSAVRAKRFDALPPSQRLFLGGDRSVRGYAFQGISPENAFGDDIGGPYAANISLEVDYQLAGSWGIAAFVDGGDVSNGAPVDLRKGVGLGVRYASPVGMIRIDLAHPLDDPDTDVRLHLSIGPDL